MPLDPNYPVERLSHRCPRMWQPWRYLARLMLLGLLLTALTPVWSGELSKFRLEQHLKKRFGDLYVLGEQLKDPPVWPVFEKGDAKRTLVAWLFESIDVERVKGYSGKPINLLITLRPDGYLMDVKLHKHREPIFRSRTGSNQLHRFAEQYDDLTIDHEIHILAPEASSSRTETTAKLHGVVRGTVSASAIDRTVMWTAVKVIEAHMAEIDNDLAAPASSASMRKRDRRMDWAALKKSGLVWQVRHSGEDIIDAFDQAGATRPDLPAGSKLGDALVDYWMLPIALPAVGPSLLEPRAWQILQRKVKQKRELFLMLDNGMLELGDTDRKTDEPGVAPLLLQDGYEYPLERTHFASRIRPDTAVTDSQVGGRPRLFQTAADSGFDISRPFSVRTVPILNKATVADVTFDDAIKVPAIEQWLPRKERPAWLSFWDQKRTELIVLGIGLLVLTAGLIAQRRLSFSTRRLSWFRTGYLLFTLCFVGWYAQAQLTIVTVIAALQAALQGEGVAFMLADPLTVVLWAFVLASLIIWGRGTFCGWLCPFGAFQELINTVATRFGLRKRQLHSKVNAVLRLLKYVVLAALLLAAVVASPWLDTMIEVEPFKTSISMSFQRSWPYVVWAVACLALSLLVYRGYCRYLCPLGAALALLGRVRLFDWIPRRQACGTPCQTCRFRCTYQAISPAGKVAYSECFQCLDCVSIYQDDKRCMPLIIEVRRSDERSIPILTDTARA